MNIKQKLTWAFAVIACLPVVLVATLVVINLRSDAEDGFVEAHVRLADPALVAATAGYMRVARGKRAYFYFDRIFFIEIVVETRYHRAHLYDLADELMPQNAHRLAFVFERAVHQFFERLPVP